MDSTVTPLGPRSSIVIRLRDALQATIEAQGLKPGDQIPSESELAEQYDVARGSVREALKLLEQDGLIDVRHGRGRFLSATSGLVVGRPVTRFESLTEMLAALGYETCNRVLDISVVPATHDEASALTVQPGADVIRVRRLRIHDKRALVFSENVFSAQLFDGEVPYGSDVAASLSAWMADRGCVLVSSAADIQAVACPSVIAMLPEVDAIQPWLLISERCVDHRGAQVLLSRDYHRGDTFTFHVLRRRPT
ncbi:MAG: GntR family transcriptional regulator [Candidatus Dormibacteraceae bacterium]